MISRRRFLAGLGSGLMPLPASAQAQLGVVRDVNGEVALNGFAVGRQTALQPGQTLVTGPDGQIRFTIGNDAFFLRPNSRLRLESSQALEPIIDLFRLVAGALGATFQRGRPRSIATPASTIGIRGTGVYIETSADWTYACTCFGSTAIGSSTNERLAVSADNHEARLIRAGVPIARAAMERHTNEEIAGLEALVGRPNPFRS